MLKRACYQFVGPLAVFLTADDNRAAMRQPQELLLKVRHDSRPKLKHERSSRSDNPKFKFWTKLTS